MKAVILAITLLVAVASAQITWYCVDLVQDDASCEGFRTNWPTKVCNFQQANFSSASACDAGFSNPYNTWAGFCPLKNSGNQSFCEGTGYITGYTPLTNPCFSIRSCTTASDCELTTAPTAPAPVPALLCYDCCTFCFDDATCTDKVNKNQTYTKDAECTPCHTAPTASNTPSSGNPSTTPGTSNTPKGSTGAVVVVSGIVLAFSALLF